MSIKHLDLVLYILICTVSGCASQTTAQSANAAAFDELIVHGEDAPNGNYDPSLGYGLDGIGWMAYSAVRFGKDSDVQTRIARSNDHGASWQRVQDVNVTAPVQVRMPNGKTVTGKWWHEVPTLVYDADDRGREWKLFWHRYASRMPHRNEQDRLFVFGWIAYRHAPSPTGPWSEEVPLFGAGPFPLPPFQTRFKIGDLHPDLKQYIVLTEPGSLYDRGRLYLSLQGVRDPKFGKNKHDIILLASDDHGERWRYISIILRAEDAAVYGADWFTGSSLVKQGNRTFLFVCPEVARGGPKAHRGTLVFEFDDIARGTLQREATQKLRAIAYLKPQLSMGGQSDYDAQNTSGGIVMPQLDPKNLPRLFRLFNTHVSIQGADAN